MTLAFLRYTPIVEWNLGPLSISPHGLGTAIGFPALLFGALYGTARLVEDRARGVLVGATAAGPNGGEVLGLLTLAVHAEITVERLQQMIYAYPTFHRGVEDALRDLVS